MIKLTEIEQRATAAKAWTAYMRTQGLIEPDWPDAKTWADQGIEADDAAHIATMSPDVALRMVEALRAARGALAILDRMDTLRHIAPAFPELDALRAALSEIEE